MRSRGATSRSSRPAAMSIGRRSSRRCNRLERPRLRRCRRRPARLLTGNLNDVSGLEEFLGILRHAVDLHLVMDMRPGAAARAAEQADLLAAGEMLSQRNRDAMQMGVARDDAGAVIDVDDAAELV